MRVNGTRVTAPLTSVPYLCRLSRKSTQVNQGRGREPRDWPPWRPLEVCVSRMAGTYYGAVGGRANSRCRLDRHSDIADCQSGPERLNPWCAECPRPPVHIDSGQVC